jgi:small neutral amino acid transporter SnatA (MarC family)
MNGPKAAFMVKILGRTGVRIFYALLGAALVAFSVYGYLHPEVMHSRRLGI